MPKVRKNTAAIDLSDKIEPLNENFATFQRPSTEYTEKGAKSFHVRLYYLACVSHLCLLIFNIIVLKKDRLILIKSSLELKLTVKKSHMSTFCLLSKRPSPLV